MTFAQKVLAQKAGLDTVAVGQIVEIEPDVCLSHDNTAAIAKTFAKRSWWVYPPTYHLGKENRAIR